MICRLFTFGLLGVVSLTGGLLGDCCAAQGVGFASVKQKNAHNLTMRQAFKMGLESSRELQSARFEPMQVLEDYNKARSIYDPIVFLTGSAENSDRPTQSQLDGVPFDSALKEERWQIQAGIKNRLPTGGSAALYQEGSRLDSTSSFVTPNPQYQSRLVASWTQPLLKGFGDHEGSASIFVADLNRQIAVSVFRREVSDVLTDIASNYWQLYYEQNVARVSRESYERAEEVYQREKAREDHGLSKPVDVDRALGAMGSRKAGLLRAMNQVRLTTRQLWLSLAPEQLFAQGEMPEILISDEPHLAVLSWSRREILAEALNFRQELVISRDTVEVSQQKSSLAGHNQLPVLDLILDYEYRALEDTQSGLETDPYDDDHHGWKAEIAFEWPIGGHGASAEKRKADYRLLQSKADMRLVAEKIVQEVDVVLDEILLAEQEMQVTREAMEAARRVMKGEEVLFELGKKSNQDLLVVQDYFGSAEKESLRAQARYNLNLVSLSRVRGTLLNDYDLSVALPDLRDKSAE
jgi:outer membrane protein